MMDHDHVGRILISKPPCLDPGRLKEDGNVCATTDLDPVLGVSCHYPPRLKPSLAAKRSPDPLLRYVERESWANRLLIHVRCHDGQVVFSVNEL
jgi:hypothetical protein